MKWLRRKRWWVFVVLLVAAIVGWIVWSGTLEPKPEIQFLGVREVNGARVAEFQIEIKDRAVYYSEGVFIRYRGEEPSIGSATWGPDPFSTAGMMGVTKDGHNAGLLDRGLHRTFAVPIPAAAGRTNGATFQVGVEYANMPSRLWFQIPFRWIPASWRGSKVRTAWSEAITP